MGEECAVLPVNHRCSGWPAGNASQKQIPKIADSLLVHLVVAPNCLSPSVLCFQACLDIAGHSQKVSTSATSSHHGDDQDRRQCPGWDNPDISKCLLGSSSVPVAEHRASCVLFQPTFTRSTGVVPILQRRKRRLTGNCPNAVKWCWNSSPGSLASEPTWILE